MVMSVTADHALPWSVSSSRDDHCAKDPATEPGVSVPLGEMRVPFAVVLLSTLALAAVIPFARMPLPKIVAFIPSYESALAINDLVTAVLLFGRVGRGRSLGYLALGCGYLFNAVIIVAHALTFPDVFSTTGLLGANDQTTAWLYVFWHGGFPLFVMGYALLRERDGTAEFLRKYSGRAITLGIVGVLAVVSALTVLATAGGGLLPRIIEAGDFSLMISSGVSPAILVLSTLSLLALWRRHDRTMLDVWLMVVMSTWTLDVMLSAVISSTRYDLGWYGGRLYGLSASCCLLVFLMIEINRLYGRLTDAVEAGRKLQEHLTFKAENDSLTGLPNRALFYDRLETAMRRCRRSGKLMALLYLDIDHFKAINDSLGHAAGDELLREFGQRVLLCMRASDTVARLGGDEFTVIMENFSSPENARRVVDKLMSVFAHPYVIAGQEITATVSVGVACFGGGEMEPDGLVKEADAALYEAKRRGRDGYWIHQAEPASSDSRSALVGAAAEA
jgi:diguanylate cyclase (GGDEF)-like protein